MVDLATVLQLVGGLALLFSNGFFVVTEFAMTRVRQFPEEEFRGRRGLERAWEMTEELEIFLSGCQLFGIERTKLVARYGAPILYWWTTSLSPIIRFADWVSKGLLSLVGVTITRSWADEEMDEDESPPTSRSELRSRMGSVLHQGSLTAEREREVINALAIGGTSVAEVMIERSGIVALSTAEPVDTNLELMAKRQHTRFPLVNTDLEAFVGVVYTPAVLSNVDALRNGERDLESLATSPLTVPSDIPVSDLIDRFQEENQELALVTDTDDERVVGLVTATDAFEAIAGDIEDPLD